MSYFDKKDDTRYFVKTDQKRLQQVLLNLLSNAIKFTNEGGTIEIVIEYSSKSELRALVIDKGVGIKDQDKGKIFKLFSSIKDEKNKVNVGGIGLGLVISKMIVSKFNGEIDFESVYKKGTTFYFTFEHQPFSPDEIDYSKMIANPLQKMPDEADAVLADRDQIFSNKVSHHSKNLK